MEIVTTTSSITDHVPNVSWPIPVAMLEMAVAVDQGLVIASLTRVFEPTFSKMEPASAADFRCDPTRRSRVG